LSQGSVNEARVRSIPDQRFVDRFPRGPAVRAGGNLTPIEFEFGIAERVVNDDAAAVALRAALASSRKRPLQLGGATLAA
jgi:hypothetical protein